VIYFILSISLLIRYEDANLLLTDHHARHNGWLERGENNQVVGHGQAQETTQGGAPRDSIFGAPQAPSHRTRHTSLS
jgi:hypothetical protein